RRVNFFGISEPNVQVSSFEDKDRIIVELPGVKDTDEAIGLIGQTAELKFAEINEEGDGFLDTDLTGADLEESIVDTSTVDGSYVVGIRFNEEGTKKFSEITERNVGKPLAILIDDNVISAPIVSNHIPNGNAVITGDFTRDDAKNLSIQLNAGALPAPIQLIEQRTIGATLGSESVSRSVDAGLIGLGMVLLFMVLIYGRYGVIAKSVAF
ncbi:MAG: protein translocase subunit SecD, partial [Cyanobacteria bacterium J149]